MTTLKLTGGLKLDVDGDFAKVSKALEDAIAHGTVLKLHDRDGRAITLNPQHVLYVVTTAPQETAPRATDGAPALAGD